MSKDMLGGITLAMVAGLINDLFAKLTGPDGQTWLTAFKRFLRKEDPWEGLKGASAVHVALWFSDGTDGAVGFLLIHADEHVEFVQLVSPMRFASSVTSDELQFLTDLRHGPRPLNQPGLAARLRTHGEGGLIVGHHKTDAQRQPHLEQILSP